MSAPPNAPIAPPMRAPSPARACEWLPTAAPNPAPAAPPMRAPVPALDWQPTPPPTKPTPITAPSNPDFHRLRRMAEPLVFSVAWTPTTGSLAWVDKKHAQRFAPELLSVAVEEL